MRLIGGYTLGLLATLALFGCNGRPRAAGEGGTDDRTSGPFVAVLDLSDGVPEQSSSGWLGLSSRDGSIEDLAREADVLGKETDLRGVIVRLGTARVGLGRAEEVGALLASLGEKRT